MVSMGFVKCRRRITSINWGRNRRLKRVNAMHHTIAVVIYRHVHALGDIGGNVTLPAGDDAALAVWHPSVAANELEGKYVYKCTKSCLPYTTAMRRRVAGQEGSTQMTLNILN
jgi:hypothetical protein